MIKHLASNSGYAVATVGKIERSDGRPFAADDAVDAMQMLNWYLSFVSGRWTGPCLIRGFSTEGTPIWEVWHISRVDPYRTVLTWINGHPNEQLSGPFPGFVRRWADDEWKDVLTTAVHWFIEANKQAGSVEGSIMLTQTAFELLASFVLVENEGWLSSDGYGKLPAADQMRLLFRWVGLSIEIPPTLTELTKLGRAENCPDVPSALTFVRNKITHPTKKNRKRFDQHSVGTSVEAWSLGIWALELCLLRLCDYRGTYWNRITHRAAWQKEPVPWAK